VSDNDTELVKFEVIAERPKPGRHRSRTAVLVGAGIGAATLVAAIVRRRRSDRAFDATAPADLRFMYAMHNAMRRDLERLERAVQQWNGAPPAETLAGFDQLAKELHAHHEAEDEDLWPMLRARLADERDLDVVAAMVDEHARIPPALDAVAVALRSRERAGPAVAALTALVREHLDHEERAVLPLVRAHLSNAEWHQFLRKERNKQSVRGRVEFLGWVLDQASTADEAAVLEELPPPGRAVYRRVLRPRYERRQLWAAPA
jgi:hemerythrin-like domain-containing protein